MNISQIPLNALRAFEAAARLGRQNAAAETLGVTHGAVSRQIRLLEEALGVALFEGPRSKPVLSPAGRRLAPALTRAFGDMDSALRLVSDQQAGQLDIACLSSFAVRWLIPRLHRFNEINPAIDVRLSTNDGLIAREPGRFDLLVTVLEPAKKCHAGDIVLFTEKIGPVLAPVLAAGDITRHPRLSTRTRTNAWPLWEELSGLPVTPVSGLGEFEHYSFAIEAAASGLGACVVPYHLVVDDLTSGRLVAPAGFRHTGYRYILRPRQCHQAKVARFCNWMQDEITLLFPELTT